VNARLAWGLVSLLSGITGFFVRGLTSPPKTCFFELGSFGRRHRPKEGLHPSHLCFNWLLVSGLWTVSGIVSFLSASVTCPSCVDHVSSV